MTTNQRRAPASIAILGDGVLGHAAALALHRAIPAAAITLVTAEATDQPYAEDASLIVPAAIPALALLGLDEPDLVARGLASYRLCERFERWGPERFAVDHSPPRRLAGAALHQLWLAHGDMRFDALSAAVALTERGRFTPEVDIGVEAALVIDQRGFRDHLAALADRAGITQATLRKSGPGDGVAASAGLLLADGRTITPDLIVETRCASIPGDAVICARERDLPASAMLCDGYSRTPAGWQARWSGPVGDREIIVAEREAVSPDVGSGWRDVVYASRRNARHFSGKIVSLTDSPGPFLRLGLSLGLQLLDLLIELLPASPPEPLLVAEFNRRAMAIADEAFAFVAAFESAGDPAMVQAPAIEMLAAFAQNGRFPPRTSQLIGDGAWAELLIGLGMRPSRSDAIARSVPAHVARSGLAAYAAAVASAADGCPRYRDWLRAMRQHR